MNHLKHPTGETDWPAVPLALIHQPDRGNHEHRDPLGRERGAQAAMWPI